MKSRKWEDTMLGRNNFVEKGRRLADRQQRFTIRRLSVGVVSVLSASLLFFGGQTEVQAEEAVEEIAVEETVVTDEEDPAVLEGDLADEEPDLTTTEEETTEKEETPTVGNDPTLKEQGADILEDPDFGKEALEHVEVLSGEIGSRVVGTPGEAQAMKYILDQLSSFGYKPEIQTFTYKVKEKEYTSHNIIATKKGESDKEVIVGAHYDSVNSGGSVGADDNASGIGVLLETAKRFADQASKFTLKFIAFSAEEVGLKGSKAYAASMTEDQVKNTLAMINMDSLIAGDKKYIHAGMGGEHWALNQAFDIAKLLKIDDMEPNPGLNEDYPFAETGDWSDHAPFNKLGIPIVYFEGTNWEIGDKDGYVQTEDNGPIFHTGMDNLEFLNETYPGRVEDHLYSYSAILYNLLMNMADPASPSVDVPEVEEPEKPIVDGPVTPAPEKPEVEDKPLVGGDGAEETNPKETPEEPEKDMEDSGEEMMETAPESSAKSLPETGEGQGLTLLATSLTALGTSLLFWKKKQ